MAKRKPGVDSVNASKKFNLAAGNFKMYAKRFPLSAASYYVRVLTEDIINGQYVGVISGNLRRSFKPVPGSLGTAIVRQDGQIAPYAVNVAERTIRKYGKSFMVLTTQRTKPRILDTSLVTFRTMQQATNKRKKYIYRNLFPA